MKKNKILLYKKLVITLEVGAFQLLLNIVKEAGYNYLLKEIINNTKVNKLPKKELHKTGKPTH